MSKGWLKKTAICKNCGKVIERRPSTAWAHTNYRRIYGGVNGLQVECPIVKYATPLKGTIK